MQRKQLIIIGMVLTLLLLVGGGALLVLRPWEGRGQEVSSGPPGPGTSEGGSVKAEPGDTEVILTWEPMTGASGYFVYRDGGKDPLNPSPLKETRYEDIGLSNGRTYMYEVAAVDAAGIPGKRTAPVQVAPKPR